MFPVEVPAEHPPSCGDRFREEYFPCANPAQKMIACPLQFMSERSNIGDGGVEGKKASDSRNGILDNSGRFS